MLDPTGIRLITEFTSSAAVSLKGIGVLEIRGRGSDGDLGCQRKQDRQKVKRRLHSHKQMIVLDLICWFAAESCRKYLDLINSDTYSKIVGHLNR